ncbi:hypothetical protein [Mycolicibacterium komossense]|uniref:Uncharacterized protein n=1 Tax=Mycolicibacterium komossense TaxID=1779 RepID=A0ABT3CJU5_9MYCO|nr:hypothetical protein [Mycolicibacterium komossense]MCV7229749.1 hypothetical protein [Mycolicibacterium komossense]
MEWMTIGGYALLVFIAISVVYIVVVFMRRLKANGLPEPPGYAAPYLSVLEGPRAIVEPPAWVSQQLSEEPDEPCREA